MSIVSAVPGSVHLGTIPAYEVICSIHNPNNVAVTHNVYVKWGWASEIGQNMDVPSAYQHNRWWNYDLASNQYVYAVSLALEPGETKSLVSPREVQYGAGSNDWIVNTPLAITNQGVTVKVYFMIVDELGNHSAPVSVGSYVS
jgi:hypothetical protein